MISNINCEKFNLIDKQTGYMLDNIDDINNIELKNIICFIVITCTHDTIKGFNLYDFEPFDKDENTTFNNFIQNNIKKIEELEILNKI